MNVRLLALGLVLLSATACRDFEGDLGRLGFVSNLQLGAGATWTPDHPIAAGTRAVFAATEVIGRDDDDVPAVAGRIEGPLAAEIVDDAQLAVSGRGRAVVWFEGEATDRFAVDFVPAVGASLADPAEDLGVDEADFALAPGAAVTLSPALHDRRGRALGYVADDLDVSATGPLSAWVDSGVVHLAADGEAGDEGTIAILYRGKRLGRVPIAIASPDDVREVELVPHAVETEDGTVVVVTAVAWLDDDTRLLGFAPEWSWTGTVAPAPADRPDQVVLLVPAGGGPVAIQARHGGRVHEIAVP